jgi:hypothetical protein
VGVTIADVAEAAGDVCHQNDLPWSLPFWRMRDGALLEYMSDRVREAEVSNRVREAEDRMKRIADRVYKVGRKPDEADSRSGIQSR